MERKMKWVVSGYITMTTILVVLFLLNKNYHAAAWAGIAVFWFWQLRLSEARNDKLWKEHMKILQDQIDFLEHVNRTGRWIPRTQEPPANNSRE